MTRRIYEETGSRDRHDTVGKSADEESEKSDEFHCMNVEGKKAFQFLAEHRAEPYNPLKLEAFRTS
jgi:hypothetical protein